MGEAPKAKMPNVDVPAAAPLCEAALDAVALPLVSQANVYLLRVEPLPTPFK